MNLDSTTNDFFERVYEIVIRIPKGYVTTYGHIARALGSAQSSRMVGWAMNAVPHHARRNEIPAHRVINRNGELTGKMHFETPTMMEELLLAEGVTFIGTTVDMKKHLWTPDELQHEDPKKKGNDDSLQSGLFE